LGKGRIVGDFSVRWPIAKSLIVLPWTDLSKSEPFIDCNEATGRFLARPGRSLKGIPHTQDVIAAGGKRFEPLAQIHTQFECKPERLMS